MKKISVLLFLLFFAHAGFAQNKIEHALQTLSAQYPQEKIFLQFTKGSYVAGEQIWFKAYVFESYNRSLISSSLHLVLYNDKKQTIAKKFIPLFQGEGEADFLLPDSLPEAVYYIRAYTQWMLNFDESFQYLQAIPVYNPTSQKRLVADTMASWTVAAFPEGGNLVEGLNSKIAIRLKSDGILPPSWSGYVIDAEKPSEKISSFQSLDRNVASFFIIPEKNKKYQVVLEDKFKRTKTIDLPAVADSGLSMQVNSGKGRIHYALRYKNPAGSEKPCTIVGTINNVLVYRAQARVGPSGIAANIPTDQLVNGILQLTVLDNDNQLLGRRLCFIEPSELKTNEPSFARIYLNKKPRELNTFEILPDTTSIYYDILVLDGNATNYFEEDNILTWLYLSSDLTGKIHNPARYIGFDADLSALDAIMISEQWQRFSWNDILNNRFPEIKYKPAPYLAFKGTAFGKGNIAANVELNLILKYSDSSTQFNQVKTDSRGNFELSNLGFQDAVKVYYQINDKNATSRDLKLSFESLNVAVEYSGNLPPSRYVLVQRTPKDIPPPEIARAVQARDNFMAGNIQIKDLAEVKVVGKQKSETEKLNEKLTSPMFRTMNETVFDFVNDNKSAFAYSNIIQYLQGRVPGLQVENRNGNFVPMIRGQQAGIYLDEMPADPSMLNSLPISDIAMVKVMKSGFIGTSAGGGGGSAIAIYTRRGDTRPVDRTQTSTLNNAILPGYDRVTAFTGPDYTDPSIQPVKKDTRDVLYWQPQLEVDGTKSIPVRFFNNDDAKNLRVIIIGFAKNDDTPLFYNEIIK